MVDSGEIENLPLGDRLKKANHLARELSEHLRQAYLPKLMDLRGAAKIYDSEEVSDQQILDHTLAVLQAEEFTAELYARLRLYLDSIKAEMGPLLFTDEPSAQAMPAAPEIDVEDVLGE
ncbi:MAG: hypothetical protein GY758_28120 [Fuerstiella sp.]|jgi:hypothetical protein|nr:hypothetical protein [Fuerstiella sp.]MCP4511431.1 hypothetical protein [Fuerstiella sp.]MDG2128443.1 hypothetical protein [Fuerstiella sp.]